MDTSNENPPSTALSTVTLTVIGPSSSLPLISVMVTVAVSSLVMVKLAPSVMSISPESTVLGDKLLITISTNSSTSTFVSPPIVIVKVSVSLAVPSKVSVAPVTSV